LLYAKFFYYGSYCNLMDFIDDSLEPVVVVFLRERKLIYKEYGGGQKSEFYRGG
jgi:hypothetical protein